MVAIGRRPSMLRVADRRRPMGMVGIAQLVEHWIVDPAVAGSSPVTHPKQKGPEPLTKATQEGPQAEHEGSGRGSMFGSMAPDPAVGGAPLFMLAADDSHDDAGRPETAHAFQAAPAAPTMSIRADVGRALADGLARSLASGENQEARRILAALAALAEDEVPDAMPVSGAPAAAERRKRGDR
jgi:hypothetical protein